MSELVLAIESPVGPIEQQRLHDLLKGPMEEGMPRRVSLVAGTSQVQIASLTCFGVGVGAWAGGARPLSHPDGYCLSPAYPLQTKLPVFSIPRLSYVGLDTSYCQL